MAEVKQDRKAVVWERHLQTIIMAVVIGALTWVGTTLIEVSKATEVMVARQEYFAVQLSDMKAQLERGYTQSDAQRDQALAQRGIDLNAKETERLETELIRLRERVLKIESTL